MADLEKLVEEIKGLSLLEASELVKALEEALGVSAAAPMAAMPMMSMYTILAQIYGREELAAAAMLVTTVLSFFTISGLLILLQPFSV